MGEARLAAILPHANKRTSLPPVVHVVQPKPPLSPVYVAGQQSLSSGTQSGGVREIHCASYDHTCTHTHKLYDHRHLVPEVEITCGHRLISVVSMENIWWLERVTFLVTEACPALVELKALIALRMQLSED